MKILRDLAGVSVAFLLALTILLGLGVWQLRRLAWKTELLRQIAERTAAPPQSLPAPDGWSSLKPDDYAYRRVVLSGRFLHDDEAHVFRPLSPAAAHGRFSGVGDLVLTPLRLDNGDIVIVNRGFVPEDRRDPATRPAGQSTGRVTVTGLMREPESRNPFTPADDPAANVWYTRDPAAMAAWFHLDRVAPFTVDAEAGEAPDGLPQGGETVFDIPNNHLSYALTWFGLAGGLCLVFIAFVWRHLSLPRRMQTRVEPGAAKRV